MILKSRSMVSKECIVTMLVIVGGLVLFAIYSQIKIREHIREIQLYLSSQPNSTDRGAFVETYNGSKYYTIKESGDFDIYYLPGSNKEEYRVNREDLRR